MQVFYINLDKDTERRESMERQLSSQGLRYERIPGVYGRELNKKALENCYSARRALRRQSRKLTCAEIGCALSHIHVYRRIVEQALPYALILEDDVVIPDGFGDTIADLDGLIRADRPEILLLSPARADLRQAENIRTSGQYKAAPFICGFFTSSYIVTRLAAQSLLKELHPVSMVADNWLRLKTFKVVDIYTLSTCQIEQDQDAFGSSTTDAHKAFPNLSSRMIYKLRRIRCVILDLFEATWRRQFHPYNDVLKLK